MNMFSLSRQTGLAFRRFLLTAIAFTLVAFISQSYDWPELSHTAQAVTTFCYGSSVGFCLMNQLMEPSEEAKNKNEESDENAPERFLILSVSIIPVAIVVCQYLGIIVSGADSLPSALCFLAIFLAILTPGIYGAYVLTYRSGNRISI